MAYDGAGSLFALGSRFTKIDATGACITGANNAYVSNQMIQLKFGLAYNTPSAITSTAGSGVTCASFTPPPSVQNGTISSLQVCTPDPYILQFLAGGTIVASGGTNEAQTITITGAPTGGTFTLTFNGATTAPIAYNATSAQVVTALVALSTIGTAGVTATGGPLPTTAVVVTFVGINQGQDVPVMTAAGNFTGGTTPAVAVTTTTPGVLGPTAIGYQAPQVNTNPTPFGVAIEVWSNAILNNANAPSLPYEQWVFPRATLVPSADFSLESQNFMTPEFSGTLTENVNFGSGPLKDITFPTQRVWQGVRVASLPNFTTGLVTVS